MANPTIDKSTSCDRFLINPANSSMVAGKRRAHQYAEAVWPKIVHGSQHEQRKNQDKQHEAATLPPQVHEEHNPKSCFQHGQGEQAGKHLLTIDMLVGDHELQSGNDQYDDIDNEVPGEGILVLRLIHWSLLSALAALSEFASN